MSIIALLAMLVLQPPAAETSPAPAAEVTLTSIFGIEIGTPAAEARRRLEGYGQRDAREGATGAKEVWRLEGTGFAWIAFRSDAAGRIVWITGHRRPGQEVPFDAIGTEPGVGTESIAIWHARGTHTGERLTLRGANRRAQVVTLLEVKDP